jgi:hypothetical protein
MTSALEGGEWSAAYPGRTLPPGKTRHPLYRSVGGPHGRSGQVRKISPPPGFDPQTVQPVVSRYTYHNIRIKMATSKHSSLFLVIKAACFDLIRSIAINKLLCLDVTILILILKYSPQHIVLPSFKLKISFYLILVIFSYLVTILAQRLLIS